MNEWDRDFQAYLQGLEEKGKPVILCGDLNVAHKDIDIFDPKGKDKYAGFTPEERRNFSKFLDKGFVDTFRQLYPDRKGAFSYWSMRSNARANNTGWRLDYWVVSKELSTAVEQSEIHPKQMGSDHCPLSLTLDLSAIGAGGSKKKKKEEVK